MGSIVSLITFGLLVTSISASVIRRDEALDYGSCTNPTIKWDRDQGFSPDNQKDFPHGSADDIMVIGGFICDQLRTKCKCSAEAYSACFGASFEAGVKFQGKKGQAQADLFGYYLLHRTVPSATPTPTTTPDKPKPTGRTADVAIKFSKSYVEFEGHIDPKWWFDNKIATGDSWICDFNPVTMPNKVYMTSDCEGADKTSMPLMRAMLNSVVDSTIDNATISDNERIFKHGITKTQRCTRVGCKTEEYKYTRFPREVRLGVKDQADGKGFLQGNLHYILTENTSDDCGLCTAFVHGGAGTAASLAVQEAFVQTASKLSPVISLMTAIVDIGCLAACG